MGQSNHVNKSSCLWISAAAKRQEIAAAQVMRGGYMTIVWIASYVTQTPISDTKPTMVGIITFSMSLLLSWQAHLACGAFREVFLSRS